MPPLEDRVVHDLVQQHREVEDREALDERERDPDERVRERISAQVAERQDRELPRGDGEMARRRLPVQLAHLVARQRGAELGAELRRPLAVIVRLHGT